jgi:hypothetical protein
MRTFLSIICFSFLLLSCGEKNDKWATQNVPEGGFSVGMPTPVEKTKKTEETVFGKQERHFVSWKPSSVAINKFKLFEVSYISCPPSKIADSIQLNAVLDKAIDIRKNDFSEVDIIESQAIELNGYPGRAFFYDAPKGNTLVSVKICITNGKLYDLVVIAKKNYSTNNEMSDFFNSFKAL